MSGTRFARLAALLAALILVGTILTACGEEEDLDKGANTGGDTPTPTVPASPAVATPEPIEHPTGADEFIILITDEGGFVGPNTLLTRVPTFALLGNGCFVVQGPQIEIYPGPALPNLIEHCLTEDGVQTVLRAAKDAGLLDGDAQYDYMSVADATTTVFKVNVGGKVTTVSAYALGIDPNPTGTPTADAARAKLAEFMGKVTGLSAWLPASAFVDDEHPYEITRMQIVSEPIADQGDVATPEVPTEATPEEVDGITPQVQEWPLTTPLGELGEPYFVQGSRCATIDGADLATLMENLKQANQLTQWESEGQKYALFIRPLLPGQTGCESATS
jgi:hypothetical protein